MKTKEFCAEWVKMLRHAMHSHPKNVGLRLNTFKREGKPGDDRRADKVDNKSFASKYHRSYFRRYFRG